MEDLGISKIKMIYYYYVLTNIILAFLHVNNVIKEHVSSHQIEKIIITYH